tara:strand:+ start:584 stop:1291 length:708 start_codon:yes stop_codon:yes gene_type:complete
MGETWWWHELMNDILNEDKVAHATVNRAVSVGTHALKFTKASGLHSVRCPEFKRLKEEEARQSWFTKDQVDHLAFLAVDIFDREDLKDAILFSAYTGVRQGELLKLKSTDVNLSTNTVQIGGNKHNSTKNSKARHIPISEKIAPIIKNRLSNIYLFGDDWNNKDQLYGAFKKVRKLAGFDETYCWHSLRHSNATWLGAVDHPRNIMELLGHSSINTTLRYCKPTDDALHRAVSKL